MGSPSGTVTLLFTDVEGSIRLWETDREAMAESSARHNRIVREQIEAAGGHVFKTVGEAFRAVFADPAGALAAAARLADPGADGAAFGGLRGARRRLSRTGGEPGRPAARRRPW
jgi:class 3 adenylate cyclase